MEPTPDMLRFGGDTSVLGAPALIAIAIAIAAFIVWLAVGTRDPGVIDVLKWITTGVIGVIGIAYAGSWHEVVVDAVARQVTERYGFLGYRLDWMGKQLRFEDFTAVIVEQETSEENQATSSPGSGGAKTATKTVYRKSYALHLLRAETLITLPDRQIKAPQHPLDLPVAEQDNPLVLEASARRLARLGGWPARRRGYALMAADSADRTPGPKPSVMHGESAPPPEPGAGKPHWFYRLPLMPKQTAPAALQSSPYIIKTMPHDAESVINGD